MWPEAEYAARHVDRASKTPQSRIVFDLFTALLGIVGVALFGIGLVEDRGAVLPPIGFVACLAVVAVSGFNLMQSTASGRTSGE